MYLEKVFFNPNIEYLNKPSKKIYRRNNLLKKNIRDNLLSERTGELELQTDLSKIFKPITETQKTTAREITEELKPIKEGLENIPQAITFPPTKPIGKEEEEEEEENIGEIAKKYLNRPSPDNTFGILDKKRPFLYR